MAWRDERGRYIFRYQDQEFAISRMSGLAVGMGVLVLIALLDAALDLGVFDLPLWAFALLVMLPMTVLAIIGGARLERVFGVDDVRAASRGAKIRFGVFYLLVFAGCLWVLLIVL